MKRLCKRAVSTTTLVSREATESATVCAIAPREPSDVSKVATTIALRPRLTEVSAHEDHVLDFEALAGNYYQARFWIVTVLDSGFSKLPCVSINE